MRIFRRRDLNFGSGGIENGGDSRKETKSGGLLLRLNRNMQIEIVKLPR